MLRINNTWKRRTKPKYAKYVIGRLHAANPIEGERFYLRRLLVHRKDCSTFEALKTLDDGTVCLTYLDACTELGLASNDTGTTLFQFKNKHYFLFFYIYIPCGDKKNNQK
jgi:hypothetical protein